MKRTFTFLAVLFAGVVVVLGAYTRLVDAGLGCPDWPGCYGFIGVPDTAEEVALAESRFPDAPVEADKAWPEMVHRYFAAALGLIIIGLAVTFTRERQLGSPFKLPWFLVALVILQGAFGAWTVTLKLWPQVVTAHLLGGFATLSLLWLLYLRQKPSWSVGWSIPRRLRGLSVLLLVLVVVQIAIGGWVSSNYAALACPDFPQCHGEWWPAMDVGEGFNLAQSVGPNYLGGQLDNEARIAIQVVHRIGALVLLLLGGWYVWRLMQARSKFATVFGAVLGVQLVLGILNVVLMLPLAIATLHNAGGALVLLTLVTLNYRAFTQDLA